MSLWQVELKNRRVPNGRSFHLLAHSFIKPPESKPAHWRGVVSRQSWGWWGKDASWIKWSWLVVELAWRATVTDWLWRVLGRLVCEISSETSCPQLHRHLLMMQLWLQNKTASCSPRWTTFGRSGASQIKCSSRKQNRLPDPLYFDVNVSSLQYFVFSFLRLNTANSCWAIKVQSVILSLVLTRQHTHDHCCVCGGGGLAGPEYNNGRIEEDVAPRGLAWMEGYGGVFEGGW